jgi:hypothetical protein
MCVRMQYDAWRIQYRNFANTLIWCPGYAVIV